MTQYDPTSVEALRARALAGETLSDDEVVAAVRALRDKRAAATQRVAERAAAKRIDLSALFAGGGARPDTAAAQSAAAQRPPRDPFR